MTHLSVYLLETEKSKTIEEDRRLHPERYLSDDEQADAWLALGERLGKAGLGHYEVSNWAVPGREARHNLKYWRRVPTLGLGVSAHELWRGRRRANVSALPSYLASLGGGRRPVVLDKPVDEDEAAREEIVLGLRLSEGVSWSAIPVLAREPLRSGARRGPRRMAGRGPCCPTRRPPAPDRARVSRLQRDPVPVCVIDSPYIRPGIGHFAH